MQPNPQPLPAPGPMVSGESYAWCVLRPGCAVMDELDIFWYLGFLMHTRVVSVLGLGALDADLDLD